jgi:hypothetical protein
VVGAFALEIKYTKKGVKNGNDSDAIWVAISDAILDGICFFCHEADNNFIFRPVPGTLFNNQFLLLRIPQTFTFALFCQSGRLVHRAYLTKIPQKSYFTKKLPLTRKGCLSDLLYPPESNPAEPSPKKRPMKHAILFLFCFCSLPVLSQGQFTPNSSRPLTIIATDGTYSAKDSPIKRARGAEPTPGQRFFDPIRPLGMKTALQVGAFLERPLYGKVGYLLIFSVNDSIGGEQGILEVNGQIVKGVYRLIRPMSSADEEIPEGATKYEVTGTIYLLGVS